MKYDLDRNQFKVFSSPRYKYKLLTEDMKKTLVIEALKIGSTKDFFKKLLHNYREIHFSEAMNKPNAWRVVTYEVGTKGEHEPIYKWMREPIFVNNKNLTIGQEMLNFVYWLNPKKVKEYSV